MLALSALAHDDCGSHKFLATDLENYETPVSDELNFSRTLQMKFCSLSCALLKSDFSQTEEFSHKQNFLDSRCEQNNFSFENMKQEELFIPNWFVPNARRWWKTKFRICCTWPGSKSFCINNEEIAAGVSTAVIIGKFLGWL